MAIALNQLQSVEGVNKEEFEQALVQLANQLEQIDHKIKVKTDNETWRLFQEQLQEVNKVEITLKKLLQFK